ncbi:MAG: hypothetical protein LBJ18_00870 [Rickettsiales bacterium]|jgi:hypothetical protein|nr:hypothetical protein [Rickettsiales bacterium]
MLNQQLKTEQNAAGFVNAEQMWFWFLSARKIRNGFGRRDDGPGTRVCQLVDVETLITKLYLAGRLTDEQLAVMKEFGEKRRAPMPLVYAENKKSALWRSAMGTIGAAANAKGWIE